MCRNCHCHRWHPGPASNQKNRQQPSFPVHQDIFAYEDLKVKKILDLLFHPELDADTAIQYANGLINCGQVGGTKCCDSIVGPGAVDDWIQQHQPFDAFQTASLSSPPRGSGTAEFV